MGRWCALSICQGLGTVSGRQYIALRILLYAVSVLSIVMISNLSLQFIQQQPLPRRAIVCQWLFPFGRFMSPSVLIVSFLLTPIVVSFLFEFLLIPSPCFLPFPSPSPTLFTPFTFTQPAGGAVLTGINPILFSISFLFLNAIVIDKMPLFGHFVRYTAGASWSTFHESYSFLSGSHFLNDFLSIQKRKDHAKDVSNSIAPIGQSGHHVSLDKNTYLRTQLRKALSDPFFSSL